MSEEVPQAVERHSRWPGWIWSVPIAALAIVAYLAIQQISQSGPRVTVIFPTADLKPDDTKVKYEGLEVGTVEKVTLEKDLKHLRTELRLSGDMANNLGPGTRFWIAGQSPSLNNLSALKSIISGPYIGIEPRPGKKQDHYEGLPDRPVNANDPRGTHYILHASALHNIGRGSTVYYRDLEVGGVENTRLENDDTQFRIDLFVSAPFDKLVREGTRFWEAGAVQLSTASGSPKLQMQSLPALFEGAVGFETPPSEANSPVAKPYTAFPIYQDRDAAEHAPDNRAVLYRVVFGAKEAGGLQAGAAVTLADKRVGTVTDSRLQYDPDGRKLSVVATIAIEPYDIGLVGNASWPDDPKPQMNAFMQDLVGQGLRARLGSQLPFIGGKGVELAFVPSVAPASLGSEAVPEIPAGPSSDVSGIMATVSSVANKIDAVPIDQIANELHQSTERLAAMARSPELKESLMHLDQSMTNVDHVTREANVQIGPLLTELRRTTAEAQSTLASARGLVGNNGTTVSTPGNGDLGETLYELSRAARSLRELADFLDRHPEALLRGKG